jgi:phosphoribosyl 1,2-cyclic phosphodiesterase
VSAASPSSSPSSSPTVAPTASVFVRIWGTRGSIPTPGPLTRLYGGNTSCYEIEFPNALFICDAGSGIRELGNDLIKRTPGTPIVAHLLLSHTHWDHVQGFPFFAPAYQPNNQIIVYDKSPYEAKSFRMLSGQMSGDYFPISFADLKANITWDHLADGDREIAGVRVTTFDQVHAGGSLGFALQSQGLKIVYATDNEIDQRIEPGSNGAIRHIHESQVDFVRNADLLIADGQYTDDEYARYRGWGHPSILTLVDLAVQANVKLLIVTHHDPNRTDKEVDGMIAQARARALSHGSSVQIHGAREGVEMKLMSNRKTVAHALKRQGA